MQRAEVNIGFLEELEPNVKMALNTIQAAHYKDTDTFEELTDLEGPEGATNYFGVVRSYAKKEIDDHPNLIDYLWDMNQNSRHEYRCTDNDIIFEENGFEHPQEIIQTLENLEHYVENINEDEIEAEEHERGLELPTNGLKDSMIV